MEEKFLQRDYREEIKLKLEEFDYIGNTSDDIKKYCEEICKILDEGIQSGQLSEKDPRDKQIMLDITSVIQKMMMKSIFGTFNM
jgi:hypothetical protein